MFTPLVHLLAGLALHFPPLQTPTLLLEQNHPVLGVGRLESIQRARILEDGTWFAQLLTDAPLFTRDGVTVRQGIPILREGDAMPSPPGARVRSFGGWDIDANGNLLWELALSGDGLRDSNRRALHWNARLLGREGHAVTFSKGPEDWTWQRFGGRRFGPGGTFWVTASAVGPTHSSPGQTAVHTFLARSEAPVDGNARPFETFVLPGMNVPGIGTIRSVELAEEALASNREGTLLWSGKREAAIDTDGFLALQTARSDSLPNTTPLAFEGEEAPVEGRSYGSFDGHAVALNDSGGYAFRCTLQSDPLSPLEIASDELLVWNGSKFAQEGDVLPSLGAPLDESPTPTLLLSNAGELFWSARVRNTQDTHDEAYMRGHEVLIREGVTLVAGQLVTALAQDADAFTLDPGGRFFLGRVQLQDTGQALVRIDLGGVEEIQGCTPQEGSLEKIGGSALVGGRLRIALDHAQEIGAHSYFAVSAGQRADRDGCGTPTPYGELLIATLTGAWHAGPTWILGPAVFEIPLPAELDLVDSVWFAQGFFVAPTGSPAAPMRMTNALRIELGRP